MGVDAIARYGAVVATISAIWHVVDLYRARACIRVLIDIDDYEVTIVGDGEHPARRVTVRNNLRLRVANVGGRMFQPFGYGFECAKGGDLNFNRSVVLVMVPGESSQGGELPSRIQPGESFELHIDPSAVPPRAEMAFITDSIGTRWRTRKGALRTALTMLTSQTVLRADEE